MNSPNSVSVASNVLVRLVQTTLRAIPGVERLVRPARDGALDALIADGLALQISAGGVAVTCHVVATQAIDLTDLGLAVQASVAAVVRELAGMTVSEVNVSIHDVEIARG